MTPNTSALIAFLLVAVLRPSVAQDNRQTEPDYYAELTTSTSLTQDSSMSPMSNLSLSESDTFDDICAIDELIDRLLPVDYDQGRHESVKWRATHINETFARIDRLVKLANNYSVNLSPVLQKVMARFSSLIYEISLPPECMSSLVVIGDAMAKRQLWAMKCVTTHNTYLLIAS